MGILHRVNHFDGRIECIKSGVQNSLSALSRGSSRKQPPCSKSRGNPPETLL
ncbi:hypothetical protein OROHE_019191 [Orobanche hederae]